MNWAFLSVCRAALFLCVTLVGTAHAQAAQNSIEVGAAAVQFDLSGTGTAPGLTIRGARAVTNRLTIAGSLPVSWPSQDYGKSKLFAPEAQLQYHWRTGSFRPYVGGGAGFAWTPLHVQVTHCAQRSHRAQRGTVSGMRATSGEAKSWRAAELRRVRAELCPGGPAASENHTLRGGRLAFESRGGTTRPGPRWRRPRTDYVPQIMLSMNHCSQSSID